MVMKEYMIVEILYMNGKNDKQFKRITLYFYNKLSLNNFRRKYYV
jgi:hypothetical protein